MNENTIHIDNVLNKYDLYIELDHYQLVYLLESKDIFTFRDNVIAMIERLDSEDTFYNDLRHNDAIIALIRLSYIEFLEYIKV